VPNTIRLDPSEKKLICEGEWTLAHTKELKSKINQVNLPSGHIKIDGSRINQMDSAGVWLLLSFIKLHPEHKFELLNFNEKAVQLIKLIEKQKVEDKKIRKPKKLSTIANIGKSAYEQAKEFVEFLAFTGFLFIEFLRNLRKPQKFRWNELASILYSAGYQALPIVGLLSFLIGVVIAYQMGIQLRTFGANIFIVNLLGLSILREFGPLITAIMVAGRTGSSFTAQLGIMKINQEIDALNTLGVTPAELLLLPRIVALTIALPMLTIWADAFGVLGGMVMAQNMFNITFADFLQRFQQEIPIRNLIIGLGKTPIFALIISSVGCFEGMRVFGSAESIGRNTTRSVVLGIFFIIVADALFSILFSYLKL